MPEATGRKAMAAQAGGVFCGGAAKLGPVRPRSTINPTPAIPFIAALLLWIGWLGIPGIKDGSAMARWQRVALVLPAFLGRVRPMRLRAALLLSAAFLSSALSIAHAQSVDTALVLALDVSL